MKNTTKCISCKKEISSTSKSSVFPCPECGKVKIARCENCRKRITLYKCPECGFEGP